MSLIYLGKNSNSLSLGLLCVCLWADKSSMRLEVIQWCGPVGDISYSMPFCGEHEIECHSITNEYVVFELYRCIHGPLSVVFT